MKADSNGNIVPDYSNKTSKAAVELEFKNWASAMSVRWYQIDHRDVSEADAKTAITKLINEWKFDSLYNANTDLTDNSGEWWYYIGGDKEVKKTRKDLIKQYHSSMIAAKQKLIAQGITKSITQIKEVVTGSKVYTTDQQKEIMEVADKIKNGTLTGEEKKAAIQALNKKYNINLSVNATYTDLSKESQRVSGGIVNEAKKVTVSVGSAIKTGISEVQSWGTKTKDPETGKTTSKIDQTVKDTTKKLTYVSDVWNKSKNETIQKFTSQGITGDIIWNAVTGKYNAEDKYRRELKNLSEELDNPYLTDEERNEKINAFNAKYPNNKISDGVDPRAVYDQISTGDSSYTYKKKIQDIAGRIIYDKVNENLDAELQSRYGKTLSKYGVTFSFKDRDTIADIKAIIRGTKVVQWDKQKTLYYLQQQLELKIGKLIDEKVSQALDQQAGKIEDKINAVGTRINNALVDNSVYRKIDSWNKQLTTWTSNPDTLKLTIVDKLDSAIKNPISGIANTLDNLDPLKKLGLGSLGLGKMFTDITGEYTKGYAEKINSVVQPLLKKALEVTTEIKAAVKKLQDRITELKNKAQALVERWKNTVKDAIKKQAKALVNQLLKYVKVSISGWSSSFSI